MTLLATQLQGGLWCLLLAALCFFVVHGAKLLVFGFKAYLRPPPPPEKKPEPVYFLVERKKKREKHQYAEPKEIGFR